MEKIQNAFGRMFTTDCYLCPIVYISSIIIVFSITTILILVVETQEQKYQIFKKIPIWRPILFIILALIFFGLFSPYGIFGNWFYSVILLIVEQFYKILYS